MLKRRRRERTATEGNQAATGESYLAAQMANTREKQKGRKRRRHELLAGNWICNYLSYIGHPVDYENLCEAFLMSSKLGLGSGPGPGCYQDQEEEQEDKQPWIHRADDVLTTLNTA